MPGFEIRCCICCASGNQLQRLEVVGQKRRQAKPPSRDRDVVFQLDERDVDARAALTGNDELRDDLTLLEDTECPA